MARLVKLLGRPAILAADGENQGVRGHQAWALLARIVLSSQPLDRRSLSMELFPESVDPLGSLRWCLASLRKALDSSDCLLGDPIELRLPADVEIDIRLLQGDALDIESAGPLLGGIEPQCSPEFATWLLVERARIAAVVDAKIREETVRAIAAGDHDRAIRLAELGVSRDGLNEAAHVLLVKSLAMAGRFDAALNHVEATERQFLDELGEAPSPALRSAARRTVASPPGGVSPGAYVRSLIQSGLAALAAGAADAGIDNLRAAVGEAEKATDSHLLATARLELGRSLVHAVRGFDEEGSILLRQCVDIARPAGYCDLAGAALRELGYVESLAGRRPVAAAYLGEAIALAPGVDELAAIHAVTAFNLVDWGRVDEGLEHYATSLDHARSAGNRRREIWTLGLGAKGQLAAGRLDDAETWLGFCLSLVDEQRWIAFRPWPVALQSETRIRLWERGTDVRAALEEAYALSCQLRDPCWEAAVARSMALAYAADGELERAVDWLDEAQRRCSRESDPYAALQVEIIASQVEVNQRLGRGEVAAGLARDWVSLAARVHMDAHVARAATFLAQCRPRPPR